MKKIEILVEVYSPIEDVIKILDKFTYEGIKETRDVYYYDSLCCKLKPNGRVK